MSWNRARELALRLVPQRRLALFHSAAACRQSSVSPETLITVSPNGQAPSFAAVDPTAEIPVAQAKALLEQISGDAAAQAALERRERQWLAHVAIALDEAGSPADETVRTTVARLVATAVPLGEAPLPAEVALVDSVAPPEAVMWRALVRRGDPDGALTLINQCPLPPPPRSSELLNAAAALYAAHGSSRKQLWARLTALRRAQCAPTQLTWASFLSGFARLNDADAVRRVVSKMHAAVPPAKRSIRLWNAELHALAAIGDPESALNETLDRLLASGARADANTIVPFINHYAATRPADAAAKITAAREALAAQRLAPSSAVFAAAAAAAVAIRNRSLLASSIIPDALRSVAVAETAPLPVDTVGGFLSAAPPLTLSSAGVLRPLLDAALDLEHPSAAARLVQHMTRRLPLVSNLFGGTPPAYALASAEQLARFTRLFVARRGVEAWQEMWLSAFAEPPGAAALLSSGLVPLEPSPVVFNSASGTLVSQWTRPASQQNPSEMVYAAVLSSALEQQIPMESVERAVRTVRAALEAPVN